MLFETWDLRGKFSKKRKKLKYISYAFRLQKKWAGNIEIANMAHMTNCEYFEKKICGIDGIECRRN